MEPRRLECQPNECLGTSRIHPSRTISQGFNRREVLQRVAMAMASTSGMMLLLPSSQSVGITRSTVLPSRQRQCAHGRPSLFSKLQVRKLGGGGVKARRGLREQKRVCDVGASAGAGGLPLEGSADGDSELEVSPPGNPSPQEQEVWARLSMLVGAGFFLEGGPSFCVGRGFRSHLIFIIFKLKWRV